MAQGEHCGGKVVPKGVLKGFPNRPKTPKGLQRTSPERVLERGRGKVGPRTSPRTCPYASRTVNSMVLACANEAPRARICVSFASHLAPFASPLGSIWRLRVAWGVAWNFTRILGDSRASPGVGCFYTAPLRQLSIFRSRVRGKPP